MAKIMRVGIAGLGVASTHFLPTLSKLPHIKLQAATDVRRNALQQFRSQYDAETFDSVEEMCKSPEVDAVVISTPNEFHAQHVITAAEHGKHVIVGNRKGRKASALLWLDSRDL